MSDPPGNSKDRSSHDVAHLIPTFYFQSRDIDRTKQEEVKEGCFYFFIEASVALFVSFLINVFVVTVFAEGFYGKNSTQIVSVD